MTPVSSQMWEHWSNKGPELLAVHSIQMLLPVRYSINLGTGFVETE